MCAKVYRGRDGKKKYEWMATSLEYQVQATASGTPHADSFYIDTARGLSLLNRKLIRQGQLMRIKNLEVWGDTAEGTNQHRRVKVTTIPTNWVSRNSWVKGKAMFDKMNEMALQDVGGSSLLPKYHDFKVYMNAGHKAQSVSALVPVDGDGNAISTTGSEWVYSEFSDSGATSDNYDVKYLGAHDGSDTNYTCVGLIDAYRGSRLVPQAIDPILPSDLKTNPWKLLFSDDDQTNDVIDDIETANDSPPYPPVIYVGDGDDDGGFSIGNTSVNKVGGTAMSRFRNFVAPCGLFRVEIDDDGNMSNVDIHISFDVEILGPMDM